MPLDPNNLPAFLEHVPPDGVRVRGHRVSLAHVVEAFDAGYTAESIATFFPTIKLSTIYAVLAFYLENQGEVRAYVDRANADFDAFVRANPSTAPSLTELRRRTAAAQAGRAGAVKAGP